MFKRFVENIKMQLQDPAFDNYQLLNDKKKSILLKVFFFMMIVLLLVFISINLFIKDYVNLLIDVSVLFALSLFYYFFRAEKNLRFNAQVFVFVFCSIVLFYVINGGVNNTGLIFILLLPIPVILLIRRKAGILVLTAFFVVVLAYDLLSESVEWVAQYSFDFSLRVYICFVIISLLAYLNESVFNILYSRLQETAESLLESRENYKSLSINREKFLSIISHDLKNQVAGFYSATDLLKNNYSEMNDQERMEIIDLLWESSQKNVHLLKDLLKWSMIKNDNFPYNPVNVKLERIFKEVVELFDLDIDKNHISIFLKIKSNSEVFADFDMLSAIMRNLVSNAIKFVGVNGKIEIKAKEKGDFMFIEVHDNGAGINQQTIESIRQSVSVSSAGITNENGSGFGLLLVKEFVETNKGEFFIESTKNHGTRIAFTIPLAE